MAATVCNKIITMPNWTKTPDPRGVGYVYYTRMLENRHRIAQIDGLTKEEDTYGSLLHRSIQTAIAMQNKGIKPGDFISLCTFDHFNACVPNIASLFIGVKMAAVDPRLSAKEIVYLLKQVVPSMIFVGKECVNLIEEVVKELGTNTEIVVFGETIKHTPFSHFLTSSGVNDFKPYEVENLEETAFVAFSSGTTGFPKGMCFSHRCMLCDVPDVYLDGVSMIFFCTPYWTVFASILHGAILSGTARIVYYNFDTNAPWKMFNHKISWAFLTPIQAMAFLKCEKPKQVNLSNLQNLRISGSICTADTLQKLKTIFPNTLIHLSYGQSEVFGAITQHSFNIRGLQLAQKYESSAGTVQKGFSYKIVDPGTEELLGPNQRGELRVMTQAQFSGYLNVDSSDSFDSDGWLKTGDMAYYNEDLYFYIVDRVKETFKYIVHYIIPQELENVILTHPSVDQAAVVGIPHEVDINHVTAVVVLKDCTKDLPPAELVKYVEERVEDRKRLRGGVIFTNSIPFTINGKIQRNKLRQMIINNEI